jgi:hypothetical protein
MLGGPARSLTTHHSDPNKHIAAATGGTIV